MKMKHWGRGAIVCSVALCMTTSSVFAAEQVTTPAKLLGPTGIMVTEGGDIYVADQTNHNIIDLIEGTTLAGYTLPNNIYGLPEGGYLDGSSDLALFNQPTALVEWMEGVVVSDTENHTLRLITEDKVMTLAGTGESGSKDGTGTNASFSYPRGLTVDDAGNLYIADSGNGTIRMMTTTGTVTTYYTDLEAPCGLDWYDGSLYVTDMSTHLIWKITDQVGEVISGTSTWDEGAWIGGFCDGPVAEGQFQIPQDIEVTEDGIFIADTGNGAIRVIRNDRVSTLVSWDFQGGGTWPALPTGIAVDDGVLYGADSFAGVVFTEDATLPTFVDGDADDWWVDDAILLADAHIMIGVGEDYFAPDTLLTRGMMAQILQNYTQSRNRATVLVGEAIFDDLTEGLWSADAVSWVVTQGIASGYENGDFGVDDAISRQDLAVFLYRYSNLLGVDTSIKDVLDGFIDYAEVSDYAQDAMAWIIAMGLLDGDQEGCLNPTGLVTRAQVAEIFCNWMTAVGG